MPDIAPKSIDKSVSFPDASSSEVSFGDTEVITRICLEPDCENPCVKRGRGYAKWCGDHLFNHPNSPDKAPASRVITVVDKSKVKEKAKTSTLKLLTLPQYAFIAKQDAYCAYMIGEIGPEIAENVGDLAANVKLVANLVEKTETHLALAMLTVNVGRLVLAIGVHHGYVPYSGPIKLIVPKPPDNQTDMEGPTQQFRVVTSNANSNNSVA